MFTKAGRDNFLKERLNSFQHGKGSKDDKKIFCEIKNDQQVSYPQLIAIVDDLDVRKNYIHSKFDQLSSPSNRCPHKSCVLKLAEWNGHLSRWTILQAHAKLYYFVCLI